MLKVSELLTSPFVQLDHAVRLCWFFLRHRGAEASGQALVIGRCCPEGVEGV